MDPVEAHCPVPQRRVKSLSEVVCEIIRPRNEDAQARPVSKEVVFEDNVLVCGMPAHAVPDETGERTQLRDVEIVQRHAGPQRIRLALRQERHKPCARWTIGAAYDFAFPKPGCDARLADPRR